MARRELRLEACARTRSRRAQEILKQLDEEIASDSLTPDEEERLLAELEKESPGDPAAVFLRMTARHIGLCNGQLVMQAISTWLKFCPEPIAALFPDNPAAAQALADQLAAAVEEGAWSKYCGQMHEEDCLTPHQFHVTCPEPEEDEYDQDQ